MAYLGAIAKDKTIKYYLGTGAIVKVPVVSNPKYSGTSQITGTAQYKDNPEKYQRASIYDPYTGQRIQQAFSKADGTFKFLNLKSGMKVMMVFHPVFDQDTVAPRVVFVTTP